MSNWQYANDVPTSPWRSAMSVPRELELGRLSEGLRLLQRPVRELERLRGKQHRLKGASFDAAREWLAGRKFDSDLLEIHGEFEPGDDSALFGLKVSSAGGEQTIVLCDLSKGRLAVNRARSGRTDFHAKFPATHEAPLALRDGRISFRVLLDVSSIEVFANDGESVITDLILPEKAGRTLELYSDRRPPVVKHLSVWELKSAWRKP